MSVHRLQTFNATVTPSPVRGQQTPGLVTPAGVKPTEVAAATTVKTKVDTAVLDAFLKARAGEAPKQKGMIPSLMAMLGAQPQSGPPSKEATALHQTLSEAVNTLGAVYADGLVTEGEMHQLHRARQQLHSVLGLASPQVLMMLPKGVREKVQNNLIEPLQVMVAAADRRAGRMLSAVQARDEPALRERLTEQPSYRYVDLAGLDAVKLSPFALERYQPGDLIGVPRSNGGVDKGVVVGREGGELQVEIIDQRSNTLALKSLTADEVAKANPLKIGDYLEAPGIKLWVTGTGPGGVVGTVQDQRGQTRTVGPDVVAKLAIDATNAAKTAAAHAPRPKTSRQSLQQALDTVWSQRDDFKAGTKTVYSAVYNAVVDKNVLTRPPLEFLQTLGTIAAQRPKGANSNAQAFGGKGDAISDAVKSFADGELPAQGPFSADRFARTFFRFEREGWQPHAVAERVYLNTAADHAPDVMKFVVSQIIDNPAAFPGVEMAKVSGPGAVGDRSENIVLYTTGGDATQRVLDAVAKHRALHPERFMREVPAFTEAVGRGTAVGAEPPNSGGAVSFGELRSNVITHALGMAKDRVHFGALVDEGLRKAGVDPERPHANLKVSRGLS
jgi:hypothetical protein